MNLAGYAGVGCLMMFGTEERWVQGNIYGKLKVEIWFIAIDYSQTLNLSCVMCEAFVTWFFVEPGSLG